MHKKVASPRTKLAMRLSPEVYFQQSTSWKRPLLEVESLQVNLSSRYFVGA